MFTGETIAAGGSKQWTSADTDTWDTVEFLWIDAQWAVAASNPRAGWPQAGFGEGGNMDTGGWTHNYTKAAELAVGEEISGVAGGRLISIRRNEDSDYKEFVAHIKPASRAR